ncbi:MAG: hypothetical protein ACYS0E_02565 [Planctomycetota bacterium]
MNQERPIGCECAQGEGAIDSTGGAPPLRGPLRVAHIVGLVVMILGVALVVLVASSQASSGLEGDESGPIFQHKFNRLGNLERLRPALDLDSFQVW